MARKWTTFSTGKQHAFRFRYICEFCNKETQWFERALAARSQMSKGGWNAELIEPEKASLQNQAQRELNANISELKNAVNQLDWTDYETACRGTEDPLLVFREEGACPHCKKRQSWAPKPGILAFKNPGSEGGLYAMPCFVLGVFAGVGIGTLLPAGSTLSALLPILLGLAVAILGFVLGRRHWKRKRRAWKRYLDAIPNKRLPEIIW